MLKHLLKTMVAVLAIAAAAAGPAWGQNSNVSWVLTPYGDLQDGDTVVIVDKTSARAMPNNKGTDSAPSAVEIGLSGDQNSLSDAPDATLKWVVVLNNGNYQFRKPGTEDHYLYCNNTNTGVRVGTNDANQFTFVNGGTNDVPFLKNTYWNRYLGVYNNQDWRCYTTIGSGSNIRNCITGFYKRTTPSGGGSGSQTPTLWPSTAVVYDFEAAAAAEENPANLNASAANGQKFYGWENSEKPDMNRQDYKGYGWSDGSVLPEVCHVWRRSDRINGNVGSNNNVYGLKCPSDKGIAIDGLTAGMMVVIIYDSTAVTAESKQILWAIGDGTATGGPGHPRATATIGGVEAVTGVTPIRSGDTIIVTSVTPAENGTGYIVFQVKKDMVIKQIAVWEPPQPHTVRFASGNDGWTVQDVTASASATAPAVLQNVMAGDSLVVTAPATLPGKVKSVKAVKCVDPMTLPLTIEALNNGTITVQGPKAGMQYSLNGAAKAAVSGSSWSITVAPGDKVSFYGNGTSITSYFNSYYNTKINGSEGFTCKVYGNIMSLIDEENFATATTLTANLTFANLFQNNTSLVDASNLMLPATTLAQQCYSGMFYGCSSLTAAPALPATTLKSGCYSLMFYGCRALIAAPALPATTLDQYCYSGMFNGCSALIAAPALPATTLDQYCYNQMFYGCSSLTAAPALPATTLAQHCYYSMFQGCTGLTAAPVLPATTLATECYGSMFAGDTNLTSAPALPATTLAQGCYYNMFYGCTGLTAAPTLPATTLTSECYAYMFQYCTGLTAAPALPVTTLAQGCYSGMFYGCTSLTAAPVLPATTLADNCYNNMFNGCSMLSSVTCLATNISAFYCTDNWLTGVAATGTFITPSSTNWSTGASTDWPYGYNGIPDGWTRVEYQP